MSWICCLSISDLSELWFFRALLCVGRKFRRHEIPSTPVSRGISRILSWTSASWHSLFFRRLILHFCPFIWHFLCIALELEILWKRWFARSFRKLPPSCYSIFTWIWTCKTHNLSDHQPTLGRFLWANDSMRRSRQILRWPWFFRQHLFFSGPCPATFNHFFESLSLISKLLCANSPTSIFQDRSFSKRHSVFCLNNAASKNYLLRPFLPVSKTLRSPDSTPDHFRSLVLDVSCASPPRSIAHDASFWNFTSLAAQPSNALPRPPASYLASFNSPIVFWSLLLELPYASPPTLTSPDNSFSKFHSVFWASNHKKTLFCALSLPCQFQSPTHFSKPPSRVLVCEFAKANCSGQFIFESSLNATIHPEQAQQGLAWTAQLGLAAPQGLAAAAIGLPDPARTRCDGSAWTQRDLHWLPLGAAVVAGLAGGVATEAVSAPVWIMPVRPCRVVGICCLLT